ncbi:Actin-binding, cofilin/tropomyosin type [Artemisia annua]|uniref:Actin-binding, cofilin/tropomyosin type n=1 Tax=Artemisia annua TaxID=35608 RepID=A0A2U1MJT9_ARTAN|nr:Actin-binding, cofilin/tropomyosin type [Artemisia annua]
MSNSTDSVISEILKLYDMIDEHKISNMVQQTNDLESDIANLESLCSISQDNELLQPLKLPDNAKDCCIECFRQLHSHLSVLLEGTGFKMGFERAFATLFGQDVQTCIHTMILNLDQLRQQIDQAELSNIGSMAALCVLNKQLQVFFDSKSAIVFDYESQMTMKCFADHTGIEVDTYRDTLLILMGNVKEFINERKLNQQCSDTTVDKHDTNDSSWAYTTHRIDINHRSEKVQVPSAEVHVTDQHDVLSNEGQHTDQIKPTYDTYLLEKTDSNIISNSTNMNHKGEKVITQLETKNLTINNLKKRITEMCDMCNEVKAKHDSDVIATRKFEQKMAELLLENESLKKHCKNLNESIKETRTNAIEQTTSLIVKNDEFKAQLQEKGFTITALKNELRKATGIQPTAFRSERPKLSKTRFASQVDAEQVLTKPVTTHYLPKIIVSSSAKPQQVVTPTPSSSRISLKIVSKPNIKARKRALLHKDGILGSKPCMNPPRILKNNAKVQPVKSRICSKSSTMHKKQNKPKTSPRWIQTAKSLETRNNDKSSTMHKKLSNPRPCHKWIPTGRIFKDTGLKWIPTGKILTNGNTMVDRENPKGLDTFVTNPYICNQVCNQSSWMVEDLVNYHFKELRCSTQCHTPLSLWIIARGGNVSCFGWVRSSSSWRENCVHWGFYRRTGSILSGLKMSTIERYFFNKHQGYIKRVVSLGGSKLINGLTNWEGVITQLVSVSIAVDSHQIHFKPKVVLLTRFQCFWLMLHVHNDMMIPMRSQSSGERFVYIKDAQQVISAEMISASSCYFGVIVSSCVGYMRTIWIELATTRTSKLWLAITSDSNPFFKMGKTRRQKGGCSFYRVKFTWAWITLYPCFLDLMAPSASRIRAKMLYATSKDGIRRVLDGIHYELQATDPTEMGFDVIQDRAK